MQFEKQPQNPAKTAVSIGILAILIVALLFVLVWTGVMKCGTIPGMCDAYYYIFGEPKVLIVYGDAGLGNPELLHLTMADPTKLGIRAQTIHLSQVNTGNLREFQLVIVEKSRKMSTNQIKMFIDYATGGGRLVWTGDAGAETDAESGDELAYANDLDPNAEHKAISPWARKTGTSIIRLDVLLGLTYVANFCEVRGCTGTETFVGNLQTEPTASDRLIYGIAPNLKLYASEGKDFAIVKENGESGAKRVLSVAYGPESNLVAGGKNYGKVFPMIVSSGLGGKVVYYATPPETFVEDGKPQKYYSFITNLYYDMFR
ncbi:MAG: hypothetical protein WC602_05150 [archaeon]